VFRENVAALMVRAESNGPAASDQPGPVGVHDLQAAPDTRGTGPVLVASQPPQVALTAEIVPAAVPGAVLLGSETAAQPAAEALPAGQPRTVLADLPSVPPIQPGDRAWLEGLQASAHAVLTGGSVQTLGSATAGLFAGCLLVVGLDRMQAATEESARRRAGRAGTRRTVAVPGGGPGERKA
jgi:hypothetical protein